MKWIFGTILVWLIFVMSLAGWWLYFGMTTLSKMATAEMPSQLARHQRMLFTEGSVLLFSLLGGGLALFYFSYRMYKEKSAKEMFFASFTHDIKTSLFRLQLEIEKSMNEEKSADSLLGHTRKMQLDLENGLDSSVGTGKKLFFEEIDLKNFLLDLHSQWPELALHFSGEKLIRADRKALHSIFKNLLHNSCIHGQADEVSVHLETKNNQSHLKYRDNGKAFSGSLDNLGQVAHFNQGGSGFGLYIVKQWVRRMNGHMDFNLGKSQALEVKIRIPGVSR